MSSINVTKRYVVRQKSPEDKMDINKQSMFVFAVCFQMVLMKIRNPYCSANVWSSGKVTVTGTTRFVLFIILMSKATKWKSRSIRKLKRNKRHPNDELDGHFRSLFLFFILNSEDDAQRAARRIARCLQRLGFKVKFRNYRVVNCLATCAMPWPIDIIKLSRSYPHCVR